MPSSLLRSFTFADRRADRGDVHAVFIFEVAELGDFGLRVLHHVLDAVADVDEPQAVVLQAEGGEGGELLNRQSYDWRLRRRNRKG